MYEYIEKVYRERLLSQKPILKDNDIQLNYILNYLPKDKKTTILDAGCGNGNYAFYLADLGYINISAVDLFANIETDRPSLPKSSVINGPFPTLVR
jgi:2-polyprenyl-3-methyl-5-hydroxy-6-metoxy-1,4-benzoquinol methylase